ncbi:hypothetical protein [Stenotrophomonas sp. TWI602]|uniref:hypothetical protein n=1 Tax=Stenotrophomonas sp. TWI602 TaxID=3136786 RepID=UPI00320851B9
MASAAIQKSTRLTEFPGGAGIKTLALSSIFVLGSALRLKRVPASMSVEINAAVTENVAINVPWPVNGY